MKNIYVFKILVSLLYIFFTILPLEGQTRKSPQSEGAYVFSVAPVFGFLYGHAEELVYKKADSDTLLSQLIWDIKPLFLWGFSADIYRRYPMEKPGFFMNLTTQFSFPTNTGTMEDRDWQAAEDRLSHFSSHDNYTNWATLMDLSAGISVPVISRLVFKFHAGFDYMYFNWTAQNGYAQYGKELSPGVFSPWNENIPKVYQSGTVISYIQYWFILTPGFSLYIPYRFFSVNLDFQISPLIICLDQDNHPLRNPPLQFNDYMFWGLFLEPTGEFTLSFHERISLSAYVSYRLIKGPRGLTMIKNMANNITVRDSNKAGAAYSALGAGLSLKIQIR
ncbi:MAG: omptin family outer membrane protease [Spirochaetaceae bacterium]|jgi:outer membrane protease|nr:omptin family outer membrane protease [Spirochaetaceae bacterium]